MAIHTIPTKVYVDTQDSTHVTNDDHTQYHNDTRGDARYYTKAETYTQNQVNTALGTKQDTLVSGTNIKTVGGVSVLGSGDIPASSNVIGTVTGITSATISGLSIASGESIRFTVSTAGGTAQTPYIKFNGIVSGYFWERITGNSTTVSSVGSTTDTNMKIMGDCDRFYANGESTVGNGYIATHVSVFKHNAAETSKTSGYVAGSSITSITVTHSSTTSIILTVYKGGKA